MALALPISLPLVKLVTLFTFLQNWAPMCAALRDCYLFSEFLINDSSSPTCPILGGARSWNFLFSVGSRGLPEQAGSPTPRRRSRCSRPDLLPLLAALAPGLSRSGLAGSEVEEVRHQDGRHQVPHRPAVRALRPRPRPGPSPAPLAMGLALARRP